MFDTRMTRNYVKGVVLHWVMGQQPKEVEIMLQEVALETRNTPAPIILASDFPIVRDTLKSHFEQVPGIEVVGCASNHEEILSLLHSRDPKLVMLDLNVEWDDLCSLLDEIHTTSSARSLIISDVVDSKHVIQLLRHGAHGVLPRRTTQELLTKSVYTVLEGGFWISRAMVADFVQIIRESGVSTARQSRASDPEPATANTAPGQAVVARAEVSEDHVAQLGLTQQETQIISTLVSGQTRTDIAVAFGTTEETIKQQLTDIYKKLGVYDNLDLVLFGWIDQRMA
jgi:DNA-binding NarL/FixJ family response regulator